MTFVVVACSAAMNAGYQLGPTLVALRGALVMLNAGGLRTPEPKSSTIAILL
jgi:hypothetical protein